MTDTFVEHCIKFYEALDERAITKKLESGTEARVFTGKVTEVWASTNISQTYYTPVRRALERHGVINVLQRGSRQTDTVIVLFGLPDAWSVDGWKDDTTLTNRVGYARLDSELGEIKKSLGGINVIKALQELESRLVSLEEKMDNVLDKLDMYQ